MIACVCAVTGSRAEGPEDGYSLSLDTWFSHNSSVETEYAAMIHLDRDGVLANAVAELAISTKTKDGKTFRDCKIVYIDGASIGDDDLNALQSLNFETIVLQDVTWAASSKTFINTHVKNLILPDNWTKEEVNAIGAAIGAASGNQLGSCFSRGDYTHTGDVTTYSYTDSEGAHEYTGEVTNNEGSLTGTIDVHHNLSLNEDGTNPYYYYDYDNVRTYLSGDEESLNADKTQYTFYPSKEVKLNGPETKLYKQDGVTEIHSYDGDVGVHADDGKWYYGGTNKQWSNPPIVEGGTEAIVKEFYTYYDPYTYQNVTIDASDPRVHDGADGKYITITKSTQETVNVYKTYKYYYLYPEGAEDIESNRTYVEFGNETSTFDYVEHITVNLDSETHSETTTLGSSIIAYVNRGNTLRDATLHAFLDSKENTKIGNWNQYSQQMSNVVAASISGNAVALDIAGGDVVAQSDGHFLYDKEADEMGSDYGAAVGGGTRTLQGTSQPGALYGASLQKLDLENAIIEDEYCSDITISALSIINDKKSQVIIPTYTGLKTIPADFMNMSTSIRSICIPSNIETIRTRAFWTIDYVWTTSGANDPEGNNTRLDNGTQYTIDGEVVYASTDEDFDYNREPVSGTYTFSSNLKLIERNAFANTRPHVKDVYVLNTVAPECHVDAFNPAMYLGNGGYSPVITDGIITRDSYKNGGSWITMLHYPRQTTDPQIQRYTDPTRDYSVATGERDGKGAVIYYPNQTEFNRAYNQGTYGYTWNAWNSARSYHNSIPSMTSTTGWNSANQATANGMYVDNPSDTDEKKYYTFYDVTLGGNTKPEGLADYYKVNWDTSSYTYSEAETGNLYPEGKDYRGWHQFVLNAYAANTVLEEEPYRSYITDNEWWTICPEFDLTWSEAVQLFGCPASWTPSGQQKLPYVSKLKYVRRIYSGDGKNKIYLNFSGNLMEHKEAGKAAGAQHGSLDANGVMQQDLESPSANDIIMSAGVPYLIKPNLVAGSDGRLNRQFRIVTTESWNKLSEDQKISTSPRYIQSDNLYQKIKASQEMAGTDQMALVKSGTYTVPAFVSGRNDGINAGYNVEDVEMNGSEPKSYTILDSPYEKSEEWSYTFVGTFYKSFLPHYSYFLGWDSSLNGARFFYHDGKFDEVDPEMRWVNGTGVIAPVKKNTLVGGKFPHDVSPASGGEPAQWTLLTTFSDDSFVAIEESGNGGASRNYPMIFDSPDVVSVEIDVTGISELKNEAKQRYSELKVYSVDGQLKSNSLDGLSKGLYIVNGKKYVVK